MIKNVDTLFGLTRLHLHLGKPENNSQTSHFQCVQNNTLADFRDLVKITLKFSLSLLSTEETDSSVIVPVEGGRYDVNIKERTKTPVYWEGKAIEVRRCSWFYKGVDGKYVPYAEQTAEALEMEYRHATETNEWHKKIPLANGEQVTMHGPNVIVHFMPPSPADTWGSSVQGTSRPLVVKRDLNDFKIQQGESQRVDHLLFMVHGIGSACDLKMRNVEEVGM